MRKTHIVFVESAKKEVIENKIAILVDEKDLQLILSSLDFYSWSTTDEHDRRLDLITDFRELEKRLKAKLDEAKTSN